MKSIEFTYKEKTYYALVRTTNFETYSQHYVTIMNGKLESLFFGHHLFSEQNGKISSVTNTTDAEINELKQCISSSLANHLINEKVATMNTVEKYSRSENEKAVA